MRRINITALRQHLPEHVQAAQAGEEILISVNGRTVAKLGPVPDQRAAAQAKLAALRGSAHLGDVLSPIGDTWNADDAAV